MTPSDLSALVARTAADPAAWAPHVRFDPDQRHWSRLPSPPDVDLWLLTWLPDQTTELHDHGDSAAAVTVLDGRLSELRAEPDGSLSAVALVPGQTHEVPVGAVHDVRHAGDRPAVSLHGYSPPLTRMTFWRCVPDGLEQDRTVISDAEELVQS